MSFSWATTQPGLKAAVFYYGTAPAKEALTNVKAPLLGLYGGNDARVTSTSGPAKVELTRLGKRFDVEVYEGAGHAFLRQRTGANQAAAERAWPRSLEFLRENLEGKPLGSSTSSTELLASADECVDCVEPTLVTLK
jgi:carboxymethylenebutenolidase